MFIIEFFISFGHKFPLKYMDCKYFLCGSFIPFRSDFDIQKEIIRF